MNNVSVPVLGILVGSVALIGSALILWLNKRPVHRTRSEVLALLEQALENGGDASWDDFISVRIAETELEAVRLKCLKVNLLPKEAFDQTLQSLLAELHNPNVKPHDSC